jgi:hypothetical protein
MAARQLVYNSNVVWWSPVGQPLHLTHPFFSGGFCQHPIECRDQGAHRPLSLGRQCNPAVVGMALGQDNKVSYVEREDDSTLTRGAQELQLVVRVDGYPVIGRAGDIVPALDKCALQLPDGRVRIQVQAGLRHAPVPVDCRPEG